MFLKKNSEEFDNFLLNKSSKTLLFKNKETIYKVNDKINALYIILTGKVSSIGDNKNNTLILQKGSVLGLMDTIIGRHYSKDMIAMSTVSLAVVNKNTIDSFLQNNIFQGSLIKSLALDIDINRPGIWS